MGTRILVGTTHGLWQASGEALEPVDGFADRRISALALRDDKAWAVLDGRTLMQRSGGRWEERASLSNGRATCLAVTPTGALVGIVGPHLLRLKGDALEPITSFDTVEGRDAWYTPWGAPSEVRSIAVAIDGAFYVNVHVGGVVRSRDAGRSWTPTVDIEADVHQVLAHPERPDVVLAAAQHGFGLSLDGGNSWRFFTNGMHAHYARAVTVSGATVLISTSTGPHGHRAALYRRPLDGDGTFERCSDGLPWFDGNIDTACLDAQGSVVVFGTSDGRVFHSTDAGLHWSLLAKSLPTITAVVIDTAVDVS